MSNKFQSISLNFHQFPSISINFHKFLSISISFFLFALTLFATAAHAGLRLEQPDSLTNGLVGYWTFDGTDINGTTALDKSGQGNNGTITGATPAMGKLGQGLKFDGVDDYVWVSNTGVFNASLPYTMSLWAKIDTAKASMSLLTKEGVVGFYIAG